MNENQRAFFDENQKFQELLKKQGDELKRLKEGRVIMESGKSYHSEDVPRCQCGGSARGVKQLFMDETAGWAIQCSQCLTMTSLECERSGARKAWEILLNGKSDTVGERLSLPQGSNAFPDINLAIWTIYERPSDYPDRYIARKFILDRSKHRATESVIISTDIEELRTHFRRLRLVCLSRGEKDDKVILESWI